MLKALQQHFKIFCPPLSVKLTLLTAGPEVASAVAVANVPVPAFPAVPAIGACVSGTPDMSFPGAEAADTCGALNLRQPPQVTALSIDEEVPHTAHVAEAEGRGPHLGGEHEGLAVLR